MKIKVRNLLKIISYGRFSKPFLNYLIEKDSREDFVYFYKSLINMWNSEYEKNLFILELIINNTKNKSLKILSISSILDNYIYLKNNEYIKKYYNYLMENFENTPNYLRGNVSTKLMNIKFSTHDKHYKKIRLWSKMYEKDLANKPFKMFAQARKKVKEKRLYEAFNYYQSAYEIAKKYPHPTAISVALNDSTWDMRDQDFSLAKKQCKKLEYYDGYYIEEFNFLEEDFDTVCHIKRKENDVDFLEYNYLYQYSKNIVKQYSNFYEKLDNSLYENTKSLRNYLERHYKNVESRANFKSYQYYLRIMRNKDMQIKGKPLQNLLNNLSIEFNANQPDVINFELLKEKINTDFKQLKEKYIKLPTTEKKKSILSTYMSYVEIPEFIKLKKIFGFINEDEKVLKYFGSYNKRKKFFVDIFNPICFIEGRKELINNAFNEMTKKERINNFFEKYLTLDKTQQELMNTFVRNYSRYNINFRFSLKEYFPDIFYTDNSVEWKKIIKDFCMNNGLFFRTAYIAFWCFNKVERKNFLKIL
jgi:hypothetical protein